MSQNNMSREEMAMQSALAAARSADPSKARITRDPFTPPGTHQQVVAEISPDFSTPEGKKLPNQIVWVRFLNIESTNAKLPCPIITAQMFDFTRRSKYPSQPDDADRFMLLMSRLTGLPPGSELQEITADVMVNRVNDQLLRGVEVAADATFGKPQKGATYTDGAYGHQEYRDGDVVKTRFVNVDYSSKDNDAATVAENRRYLDEHYPIRERQARTDRAVARTASTDTAAAPKRGFLAALRGQ